LVGIAGTVDDPLGRALRAEQQENIEIITRVAAEWNDGYRYLETLKALSREQLRSIQDDEKLV
jgi:hypothetical protein